MENEREKYKKELMNEALSKVPATGVAGSVVGRAGEMSEEEKKQVKRGRIRALIIGGTVGLILILSSVLATLIFGGGDSEEKASENAELFVQEETKIAIFVAPISAEVKIDGEAYRNGLYEIEPGKHTAEITAMGYKARVYNFEVKADRVTLLYDYLDKTEGNLEQEDVDVLRYLSNDDETDWKITEYLLNLPEEYIFVSEVSSPIRDYDKVQDFYGEKLSEKSFRIIKETLDAYFYFARSGTKNVRVVEDSFQEINFVDGEYLTKPEFKVLADGKDEYRVRLEITRSQAEPEKAYEVWRATVLTEAGTALFQYDGRFTYGNLDIESDVDLDELLEQDGMIWG